MKKNKQQLKKDLVEDEKKYIERTDLLEKDHRKKEEYMINENEEHLVNMEKKY